MEEEEAPDFVEEVAMVTTLDLMAVVEVDYKEVTL